MPRTQTTNARKPRVTHLTQTLGTRKVPATQGLVTSPQGELFAVIINGSGRRQLVPVAQHLANAGIPVRVR